MELKKSHKVMAGAVAALAGFGFSGVAVTSAMLAYDAIFPRYERPDYTLKPGVYCYDRADASLKREELFFPSDKYQLKACYYPAENSKGLVVVSHGMHAGGDDYLPIIEYLVARGYSVFSFNYKGTYESEGQGTVGMCESLVDLDHALDYINATEPYRSMPLFLLGHSWGGYAVTSVLGIKKNIKACAAIAPMNSGYTMFVEKGEEYAGKLSNIPKPLLNAYQKILFGKYVKYSGHESINTTTIPVLIAQGVDDKIITFDGQSVTAHRKEITNPNVTYYIGKGFNGDHDDIWHSVDSVAYRAEIQSELKLMAINKGSSLTDDERREFYKTVDHKRYSAVNEELMELIIKTFDNA